MLLNLQPAHGSITLFRVYIQRLSAQLRLAFATAPYTVNLATEYKSLTHYTKVRSHTTKVLLWLVRTRFQVLFHPSLGFFTPFPHGTGSLSVSQYYLALEDGPHIQTGYHVSRPTRFHAR